MTAFTTLLGGVAASTVASVVQYVEREGLDVAKVTAELRYTKHWVSTKKSKDLGGGMIALGEGHNTFAYFIDVSVEGNLTEDEKLSLKCVHLSLHVIKDLEPLKGRVHISLK